MTSFKNSHKLVFETIDQWVHTDATMDNTWMQWRKWAFAGLKAVQPVQGLMKILQVADIYQYVKKMEHYHVFTEHFAVSTNDPLCLMQYSYTSKLCMNQ